MERERQLDKRVAIVGQDGKDGKDGKKTYMLPVKKVMVKPIFWLVDVWRPQITGKGRIRMATSLSRFSPPIKRKVMK